MLKFNTTLEHVINTQATGRSNHKQFLEFGSKKKFLESELFDRKISNYIRNLKNAFAFSVHKDLRYIIILMYYSTTKSYGYYVLDTQTLQVAQADSVKIAKKEVLELIATNK